MVSSTNYPLTSLGKETKEDLGFDTELDLELALAPLMARERHSNQYINELKTNSYLDK
tara:strand:- start:3432 stop:3605 length:174 start_codon:yes stop_codon:yes gene_type:complete